MNALKPTGKGIVRSLVMAGKRVYLLVLLLAIGCQQVDVSAQKAPAAVKQAVSIAEAQVDTQLKINRDTLLRGASEEIRTDAAAIMLFSDNLLARRVLLNALRQTRNAAARKAVCTALSRTRRTGRNIRNKGEFVKPLIDVIRMEDSAGAKLAAEAMLLFKYDEVGIRLEKLVSDKSEPVQARLNAIYALKLQLDMRAIAQLMKLLDDDEQRLSQAAADALRSLGIPTAKSPEDRKRIMAELRQKGVERFQQEWLVLQETRAGELERQFDRMRNLYLGALGTIYDGIKDDGARGAFLVKHLAGTDAVVRLWALDKVSQWRVGTQSKLPAELGPVLVNMISDPDREIRLKTAKLLSLTGELSSAERLLEQLKVERDKQVRLELFVALGGACHYALLPTSGVKLGPEIRDETLQWAGKYLEEQDAKDSQRGAEVIAKLLEADGLSPETVDKYLDLLAARYEAAGSDDNGDLRGELLGVMAGLCAQSAYSVQAAARFGPIFEKALAADAELVRQAAVDGLVNIDKSRALKLLREDFTNDDSVVIRKKIIALAGEVGGRDDLVWLAQRIGANSESPAAWQAMLRIFDGSDCGVASSWLGRFDSEHTAGKLSDEQWGSFLETTERKAADENKADVLKNVRGYLASLYSNTGRYERAAEYLGLLLKSAETKEQKDAIVGSLVRVYLRWPNQQAVVQLVANRLLEKDLGPDDVVVRRVDEFLAEPPKGADTMAIFEALKNIKAGDNRPDWQSQLELWSQRLGRPQPAAKPSKPAD